MGFMLDDLERL